MSKRVAWVSGAAISLAVLLSTSAKAACEMLNYHRVKVSPHVYLFEAAEGTTGIVNANIVAVIGRDAIVLVDAGQFPSASRKVLKDLRAITSVPVRYIVNTHWHGDHTLGNSVFKEAFPGAEIIAHSFTISEGNRNYKDYAETASEQFPLLMADMRKRMESTASEDERIWVRETLDCAELAIAELKDTRYVPADRAVDDKLEVNLGNLPVVIEHLGTGNTPGDLIVWVKTDRVVATGDMVVYPSPYAIGSDLEPWPATVERLMRLGASIYVPGHGPALRGDKYIRELESLIKTTRAQLAALYRSGVSKADAGRRLDTSSFRVKYINTPMRRQAFEQYWVKAAVNKFWSLMDGRKRAHSPRPSESRLSLTGSAAAGNTTAITAHKNGRSERWTFTPSWLLEIRLYSWVMSLLNEERRPRPAQVRSIITWASKCLMLTRFSRKAMKDGATVIMPPTDMFLGGSLRAYNRSLRRSVDDRYAEGATRSGRGL